MNQYWNKYQHIFLHPLQQVFESSSFLLLNKTVEYFLKLFLQVFDSGVAYFEAGQEVKKSIVVTLLQKPSGKYNKSQIENQKMKNWYQIASIISIYRGIGSM
ncbi:hypothetical protein TTHERM_000124049 (macronuclear) [Tetrahymena thermophila SB210]|uniref:Uncharacterized protein n=1 Tax=Tetrahymena thermophila (strain SB210) TaxID=312017 RepID=W7XL78_TETTS|nr:hypothetical protein TTHERM_000124049 [Tetrahymena thermophila SB210]EWS75814.1 hypothetical protein TTHERM_000124049 [Tetrahymena thermophila SB210]|eukprot:XP_012651736.1 hypothetical protein TTHERM_000124049 [Tetrahymena thermophila SB210]